MRIQSRPILFSAVWSYPAAKINRRKQDVIITFALDHDLNPFKTTVDSIEWHHLGNKTYYKERPL